LKARTSPTCEAWRWVRGSNFPPSDTNLTWTLRSSVHVDCRENLCISDSTVSTSCVNLRFRNTLVFHWYNAHGCFVFIDISPSTFSDFRIPFVCTSIPTWHQLHSQTGTMIGKPSSGVHMSSVKQTPVGWWLVGGL
jgi:hypothetical protein